VSNRTAPQSQSYHRTTHLARQLHDPIELLNRCTPPSALSRDPKLRYDLTRSLNALFRAFQIIILYDSKIQLCPMLFELRQDLLQGRKVLVQEAHSTDRHRHMEETDRV